MSVVDPVLRGAGGREFTAEQSTAVRRRSGPLLLAANAGSGKTSVLVERFARTVGEDGIAPERILAITFTEKAAGELRARVRARLLERGDRENARRVEGAWISTVHAFCMRVLRAHAVTAGLDPDFGILDEATARGVRQAAWREAFGAFLAEDGGGALDLAAAYGPDALHEETVRVHGQLRSSGQTVPALPRVAAPEAPDRVRLGIAHDTFAAELATAKENASVLRARRALEACAVLLEGEPPSDGPLPDALAAATFKAGNAKALATGACAAYLAAHGAYASAWRDRRAAATLGRFDALLGRYARAYAAAKTARAALDFDDLELLARDLLRGNPALRAEYAERFERVMVDEFQDSNPLQVELFELIAGRDGELVVVGDERQSIYGFRHADVEVFRARERRLGERGAVTVLSANFRSRRPILDAVNVTFAPLFGSSFTPLRAGLPPGETAEPPVELLLTDTQGWDDDDAPDLGELPPSQRFRHAEARLLAQRIGDLVADGTPPEDIVVLVRAIGDLPVYERALEDRGLSVLATGGRGYWGRQVVRDLCAWLAALANPRDELALYGVLASPLVGLSSDALMLIARAGSGNAWRAIDAGDVPALGADDRARLDGFTARFRHERGLLAHLALHQLLQRIIEATDYDLYVLSLPAGARRLANVHKLLRLAAAQAGTGADVRAFVDLATAELEADAREADAPVELSGTSAVRVMTIHAAKGLEFPVVCVADLGRGTASRWPDLLVDGDEVGLRLRQLGGPREEALAWEEIRDRLRDAQVAEEQRIAYVAMTRAEQRLILSGGIAVDDWPDPTRNGACALSWLGPALAPGVHTGALTDAEPVADLPGAYGEHISVTRCVLNRPATVGRVLRAEALAPAGSRLRAAVPSGMRPPEPPHPPAPPLVSRLSYTALALHRSCGYRFYLQRVLRLPERRDDPLVTAGAPGAADGGELEGRVRGTIVHELLEALDPGRPGVWAPNGDVAARAEATAHVASQHGVALTAEQVEELSDLVAGFAAAPLAARLARARAVHREHRFALPLDGVLIDGIVDVLAQERGGSLIVDYKTDRLPRGLDRVAYLNSRYGVQRDIYALAALRGGARRVTVAYVLLDRPEDPVLMDATAEDVPSLEQALRALVAGPTGGRFEPAREPHRTLCAGCPGRGTLCPRPVEATQREAA